MIKQISIKTRFGWISAFEKNDKIIRIKFGKYKNKLITKNLKIFKKDLNNFFLKKKTSRRFKFITSGNIIQKKIWNQIKNIKYGKTKTYNEIARKNNLSPRHVGKICGQNKILLFIPCHRVIRSDGSLGGYTSKGGVDLKRKLLNFEKFN